MIKNLWAEKLIFREIRIDLQTSLFRVFTKFIIGHSIHFTLKLLLTLKSFYFKKKMGNDYDKIKQTRASSLSSS